MAGIGSHFQNNRRPTLTKRCCGNIEMGGEAIIIDDFEWVVEAERLELRGVQVQLGEIKEWAQKDRF